MRCETRSIDHAGRSSRKAPRTAHGSGAAAYAPKIDSSPSPSSLSYPNTSWTTLRRLRLTTATPCSAEPVSRPSADDLVKQREAAEFAERKSTKAALVDRDQPDLVAGPGSGVRPGERGEECVQHVVVGLLALILAAVVVRQERTATQPEPAAVRQRWSRIACRSSARCLQVLQEGRLAVTGVARDQHEPELAREHRRLKLPVERRLHIGLLAKGVEAAGTSVAVRALAVQREQARDVRVGVRRDRLPLPLSPLAVEIPVPRSLLLSSMWSASLLDCVQRGLQLDR